MGVAGINFIRIHNTRNIKVTLVRHPLEDNGHYSTNLLLLLLFLLPPLSFASQLLLVVYVCVLPELS